MPFETGDDGFHRAPRTGAVVASANIKGARQALLDFKAWIVDAVEEILEGAAHITQVFRGAENDGIAGDDIVG